MAHEMPAQKAMRLLGAKRIAAKCDLTTDAVWKWATQGGGRIPARHQPAVLQLAQELQVDLSPADVIGVAA